MKTVKARIRQNVEGGPGIVEVQRGKYKHWFPLGKHSATDADFRTALNDGAVVWGRKILGAPKLF